MIKLCIFDLDGTLIDSLSSIAHFCNYTLKSVGLDEIETDKFKTFVGDGRSVLIHRILNYHSADTPELFEKAKGIYDKSYESNPLFKTTVYDGVDELLTRLKKQGIKLAVCSNKPDNVVQDVVKNMFPNTFDVVCGLKDNQNKKPSPDTALKIAEELNVSPNECLFIGDTNVDIFTAKNASMKSCGVLWGFRDFDELNDAGADFIIDNPSQILDIINGEQNK